jgi:hypothetical protein
MGTWGWGIMESDYAMDVECEILDIPGIEIDYDESDEQKQALMQKVITPQKYKEVLDYIENIAEEYDHGFDKATAYQVFATLIIENGLKVDPQVFQQIKDGCVQCPEYQSHVDVIDKSDFSERVLGRLDAIGTLVKIASQYDINGGKPQEIPFEGLLYKILKNTSGGLVNKAEY